MNLLHKPYKDRKKGHFSCMTECMNMSLCDLQLISKLIKKRKAVGGVES